MNNEIIDESTTINNISVDIGNVLKNSNLEINEQEYDKFINSDIDNYINLLKTNPNQFNKIMGLNNINNTDDTNDVNTDDTNDVNMIGGSTKTKNAKIVNNFILNEKNNNFIKIVNIK